jgi:hypothetical protein
MGWASAADVLAVTGSSATTTALAMADSVITVYADRSIDASAGISTRDLNWLKQATAWQARYVQASPGYGQQVAVQQVSQDGVSITYDKEWELNLAPMAARALKNLSWKRDRTSLTPRVNVPLGAAVTAFLTDAGDQYSDWRSPDDPGED